MKAKLSTQQKGWLENIEKYDYSLKLIPKQFLTLDFYLETVKINGLMLGSVPENFRTEELCLIAVQQSGYALQFVPEKLRYVVCKKLNIK